MIERIKSMLGDEPEVDEYEVKAAFETEERRRYEQGDTVEGVLLDWDQVEVDQEDVAGQIAESLTARVNTGRELEFRGDPVESLTYVPSRALHARSGKVLVIPHYRGEN